MCLAADGHGHPPPHEAELASVGTGRLALGPSASLVGINILAPGTGPCFMSVAGPPGVLKWGRLGRGGLYVHP